LRSSWRARRWQIHLNTSSFLWRICIIWLGWASFKRFSCLCSGVSILLCDISCFF
jgi:hypothetical protein